MWMPLRAEPRPCFNQALIEDVMTLAQAAKESSLPFDFWVTGSLVPKMFNAGGDLQILCQCDQKPQARGDDDLLSRLH